MIPYRELFFREEPDQDPGESKVAQEGMQAGPSPAGVKSPPRTKSAWREFLETVGLALVIFILVRTFVMNYRVIGHSMEPNVHEGQFLLIDKLLYSWHSPQRGDIVVLYPPDVSGQIYLKRIIGLPGETIEIREGQVFINGKALVEPWPTQPFPLANWGPGTVGQNEVFVLGDNRPGSRDSRYFGMLPRDHIIGRAFLCYWPPQEWTLYRRYAPAEFQAVAGP